MNEKASDTGFGMISSNGDGRRAGAAPGLGLDPDADRDASRARNDVLSVDFSVAFRHRVAFVGDLFGEDAGVLRGVLEPSEGRPARVQAWLDADVAAANDGLADRVAEAVSGEESIELVGQPRLVQGGEASKNDRGTVERILAAINDDNLDRRSYILVVGGGAVLDAVGYAAAVAHRGVRLVRVPTTTLAQADSGVGVKTAVNLFGKKNWEGAFAVPWAVLNDEAMLASLPDRDFRAGFSEAVKVALLKDAREFDYLCEHAAEIARRDMNFARRAIRDSCLRHLEHITRGGDPFEAREARPLDFGHWSAHKIEPMTRFRVRHGEAVAIGLAIDATYSMLELGLPESDHGRILACLDELGLPLAHPVLEREGEILDGLEEFRQHLGGRLTVTLLRRPGDPVDVHDIDRDKMRTAIRLTREFSPNRLASATRRGS